VRAAMQFRAPRANARECLCAGMHNQKSGARPAWVSQQPETVDHTISRIDFTQSTAQRLASRFSVRYVYPSGIYIPRRASDSLYSFYHQS